MEGSAKKYRWKRVVPVVLAAAVILCVSLAMIPFEWEEEPAEEYQTLPESEVSETSLPPVRSETTEISEEAEESVSVSEVQKQETVTLENYWQSFHQMEDQLLVLVNGHIALPESFDPQLTFYDGVQVNELMYDSLYQMLKDAREDGADLWVASGYRDVREQEALLQEGIENRMKDYGLTEEEARENALKSFAKPGYSEHHTGLAVDFNGVNAAFQESYGYEWLSENAWKYGFVQRYPEDKTEITGIIFEPWHYRYVGREHAQKMTEEGICLEEYIVALKNEEPQ